MSGLAAVSVVAFIATLAVIIITSGSPHRVFADHNSMHAVCPGPIKEGNSGRIGIRRSGYKIKSATFFTDHRYHTAGADD